MTGAQVVETFAADAWSVVIGVVLCTVGAILLLLATSRSAVRTSPFPLAGLFALAYGLRLLSNTGGAPLLLHDPPWLSYVRAALEYLVPIPAAALFGRWFGARWRKVNLAIVYAFVACAAIAIPYEIITSSPFALKSVIDALVLALMAAFVMNMLYPSRDTHTDFRPVRNAAIVFVAFVVNEHLHIVDDPWGILDEPTGFLYFIGNVVFVLMRQSVASQLRLAAVDSELATARTIQQASIPRSLPAIAGLQLAACYEPASEVAGDFYDFQVLSEHRVGVFIADVSGHGVPAALVASMLKIAFATAAPDNDDPAALMQELNRVFVGKLERQFITASYAILDMERNTATVASAGHPPPIVVRGGEATEITAEGMILGRFPSATFRSTTVEFARQDLLVLYTDGVTETRNGRGEMFGDENVRRMSAASAPAGAVATASKLLEGVQAWASSIDDDITIVIASRS